ncbi:MAG: SpoIID/LytB domain-containing protein [Ornithinimicrobium sp.]|uniref:SpoIID/LytB domain-containing protein n=1 Tax=Ornithinimicrobium sp. TaxID=1977084 RepID=UPI003D9BDB72
MRPIRVIAATLAASVLLPGSALAAQDPDLPPGPDGVVEDQRYGMLEEPALDGVASVSPAEVVEGVTALPSPEPGAVAYPRPADDVFDVRGGGFGHGIGMSQYGADGAGKQGLDHTQILDFYYPGTTLETRNLGTIRIGITIDDDGATRVAHRPGLRVAPQVGGTTYALPSGREQWRVRSTGTGNSSCALEGRVNGTWSVTWPSGMPRSCPVTFSSPKERSVDLFLPGGQLRVYRGEVTATYTGTEAVETVNALPMESYLRSVVSAEMPSSFHREALRSQAVAARTYSARGSNGTSYYDTCDTTACQVYSGRGERTDSGAIASFENTATDAAVAATPGQVLTYRFSTGQALATTMFSSSSGGHTAAASSAHGYLSAHPDPYDDVDGNRRHAWSAQLPATSLESRYGIDRVERVQILRRDGDGSWGGRVLEARVEGFTAAGDYTWAYATGTGLRLARPWPANSTGLSSSYFTLIAEAPSPSATRVSGTDRWGTSEAVSRFWPTGGPLVYVASGLDFPDALSAAARSGVQDVPVLLTDTDSVPTKTRQALERLRPERIVVVGGSTAVDGTVLAALKPYATTRQVQRVDGGDRYETAAVMAAQYPAGVRRVYLASGADYPDALSGAALAAHQGAPLLLTKPGGLPPSTRRQLDRLNPTEVLVLGGSSAVNTATARAAGAYSQGGGFTRLAGTNRYGTAEQVSRQYPSGTRTAVVASGTAYPDALVGAALGGRRAAPLLLTERNGIPPATKRALDRLSLSRAYAVGGDSVVAERVLNLLGAYLD